MDPQRTRQARSSFLSAAEEHCYDSVGNESRQSLFQARKNSWLLALPDQKQQALVECRPDPQRTSQPRCINKGAPVDQPSRSPKQAPSTTQISELAQKVLLRARLLRAPEQNASDSGEDRKLRLAFLQSLPVRQGPPQRHRSAFARICPADRGSDVPEPGPDSILHLHPEIDAALRCFGLLPRAQGQPVQFDPDFVYPDPIGMNQPGDKPHETKELGSTKACSINTW